MGVDPAFTQEVEHRPKPTVVEADEIPIIDLSSLSSLDSLLDLSHAETNDSVGKVVAQIGDACQRWGFFQVINHGVSSEKLRRIDSAAREFFSLPLEAKKKVRRDEGNPMGYYESEHTKNVRDWKEVFDCSIRDSTVCPISLDDLRPQTLINRWPENPSELREACQDYGTEVEKLAFKLLGLIALSLGLGADQLEGFFKDATTFIRLNHYPPCPAPDLALGVGRHKDGGALTVLVQDEVGGLQVRRKTDGEWISVKPTSGAFIIMWVTLFRYGATTSMKAWSTESW
ncbi:Naringenin,2-oxoglutarate 3-dioxygenase-like protein [Drosera capensis]